MLSTLKERKNTVHILVEKDDIKSIYIYRVMTLYIFHVNFNVFPLPLPFGCDHYMNIK